MTSVYTQPTERARVVITIPFDEWVENSGLENPGDQLHFIGRFTINGVDLHLEAIRVNGHPIDGGAYEQDATGDEMQDSLNAVSAISGADGPLMTWQAPNGEEYVFVLTPHTD